jgi:hypothetical protein
VDFAVVDYGVFVCDCVALLHYTLILLLFNNSIIDYVIRRRGFGG